MTMITPSYLGETIEYSSLHACRSTLEDPTTSCQGKLIRLVRLRPVARIMDNSSSTRRETGTSIKTPIPTSRRALGSR